MRNIKNKQEKLVYGLDIGTRSIVGTVGYRDRGRFVVLAQRVKEHETRAMIDGQIHDIGAVAMTIREVTDELSEKLSEKLSSVCIAAAGRVLRTENVHVEIDLEGEKTISKEEIYALDSFGIEKAYEQFQKVNNLDMKFYCVGYSVMRYYMNNYPIGNLENHKAKIIAADMIVTFLPDDVVDGLYKAVELAGLEVANLTLEPIAAMEVAIPEMYRMLNIALIDVGAGTSDISITKDGSIVAYGMLPIAGDCLTERIARHCLVDFVTAESIKRGIERQESVEYKDIMGLPQTVTKEEILQVVEEDLESMTIQAADKIKELNADKPVSAVFVVGGGGKIEGYTQKVAEHLGIAKERCAIRGEEVLQKVDFLERDVTKDSLLVTPIGICLNYYEQSNNFVFVTFNGERIKLYDNGRLAVVDAAIAAEFPNEDLFPKRGEALSFQMNGKTKTIRGERGESAVITLNGEIADIHTAIRANDIIVVKESTAGSKAKLEVGKLPEYNESIAVYVNGIRVNLPKYASVNGELRTAYYEIQDGDEVVMLSYYTAGQIMEVMDVLMVPNMKLMVNHILAEVHTEVYDNFSLEWRIEEAGNQDSETALEHTTSEVTEVEEEPVFEETSEPMPEPAGKASVLERARKSAEQIAKKPQSEEVAKELKAAKAYEAAQRISAFATSYNQTGQLPKTNQTGQLPKTVQTPSAKSTSAASEDTADIEQSHVPATEKTGVTVMVNGEKITLTGKQNFVFVDVFDQISFDLTKPQGKSVETRINGRNAQYVEPLHDGDILEIYWKD